MKSSSFRHSVQINRSRARILAVDRVLGAFRNGVLVSWCLTKYDGSIGTLQTNPDARRLGLASRLMTCVASALFEQQDKVICFVHFDNVASLGMVEKLGYRRTCVFDWVRQDSPDD